MGNRWELDKNWWKSMENQQEKHDFRWLIDGKSMRKLWKYAFLIKQNWKCNSSWLFSREKASFTKQTHEKWKASRWFHAIMFSQ